MIADSFGRPRETKSARVGLELHTEGPRITRILGLEKKMCYASYIDTRRF